MGTLAYVSYCHFGCRVASALIDNTPFTATMVPIIETLNLSHIINSIFGSLNISQLWWALALGAYFGGNDILIGSSAGVIAAGMSLKYEYKFKFYSLAQNRISFYDLIVALCSVILILMTMLSLNNIILFSQCSIQNSTMLVVDL